jgi:nucleoside-diphosphate-sugar epimerase
MRNSDIQETGQDSKTRVGTTIGVTGATGMIGRYLVPILQLQNNSVRALTHRASSVAAKSVVAIQGEICNQDAVGQLAQGCQFIIHLAGIAHTDLRSESDFKQAYDVNVNGTKALLSAAVRHRVERVLIVSSAHVYTGQSGENLTEDASTSHESFYAKTKLEVESLARQALDTGIEVVIVRPCLTYGPHVRHNLENLMKGIARGYYFHIKGFNPLRSFLSVENAANAIVHLLRAGESGMVYNLADRDAIGLVDFVNEIADRLLVSRPRSLPYWLIRSGVLPLELLRLLGLNPPFSADTLEKLTRPFTLDTSRLASTEFQWSSNSGSIIQLMVDTYSAKSRFYANLR